MYGKLTRMGNDRAVNPRKVHAKAHLVFFKLVEVRIFTNTFFYIGTTLIFLKFVFPKFYKVNNMKSLKNQVNRINGVEDISKNA